MNRLCLVAGIFLVGSTPTAAEVQAINRSASGYDIRVGVYVNVKPDCTSGPLPSIQLLSPPGEGHRHEYKQCLALEVPAFVAFYRSRADFAGVDVLTLEVGFPGGRIEVQRISVTIGSS